MTTSQCIPDTLRDILSIIHEYDKQNSHIATLGTFIIRHNFEVDLGHCLPASGFQYSALEAIELEGKVKLL